VNDDGQFNSKATAEAEMHVRNSSVASLKAAQTTFKLVNMGINN
jgi:hypothetical protein